ncbi:hypothetical protein BY458DRAFT_514570 [Sporodiniella umbellata]|nr:hypothetical protein BY458DRAFT_514570 [Sporodiniella umbellata]
MADTPITSIKTEETDLLFIHQIDGVSLSCPKQDLGTGVLKIHYQPTKKLLVLIFNDYDRIILASNSKAWSEGDYIMIPSIDDGLWKLYCSDEGRLAEVQDIFTFYIKYENRHHIKNTLALMDPNGQVTPVVDNVSIDLDEEDFIESQEKVPVYVDSASEVKLLYQQARRLQKESLRKEEVTHLEFNFFFFSSFFSGSRMIEEKIEPKGTPFKLGEQEKRLLDIVYQTTQTLGGVATQLLNGLIQRIPTPEPKTTQAHFGWSALRATATLLGGVTAAAGIVLDSSRQGITQMIRKKYGTDAGYLAERTMGSVTNMVHLVYFDAKGISRTVILGTGKHFETEKREAIFDQHDDLLSQQDTLSDTKSAGFNQKQSGCEQQKITSNQNSPSLSDRKQQR